MRKTFLLSIARRTLDLVVVVIEPNDIGAREFDNLSSGSSNTAPNIQDTHALLEIHHVCQVVFMAGNCLVERFAICKAAEVETLAPAIFVQIGGEVVVTRKDVTPKDIGIACG